MMSRPLRVFTGRPVVIDSSIAFRWFDTSESGSHIALEMLRQHARDELALLAPAHMPFEMLNVFVSRLMTTIDMERAAALLADADILIAPVDDALLIAAIRIAEAEDLAPYDAVFIALAAALDAELVTADRKQAATRSCRVRFIG